MGSADRHHDDLRRLVESTDWFMRLLVAARQVAAPDWVIGGGVVRNLVWDHLHDLRRPTPLRDVDLAYFDPHDLREEAERDYERRLADRAPASWQPKNQARVHLWYESVFGHPIDPVTSITDAVGRFPETCTAVGISLDADGNITILAPHGLDDLFGLVLRRNPTQVRYELFLRRLADKQIAKHWPKVTVIYEAEDEGQ